MSNSDTSNLIIGGDWNVTLQSLDKRGGVPWKASTYRNCTPLSPESAPKFGTLFLIRLNYLNVRPFVNKDKGIITKFLGV